MEPTVSGDGGLSFAQNVSTETGWSSLRIAAVVGPCNGQGIRLDYLQNPFQPSHFMNLRFTYC